MPNNCQESFVAMEEEYKFFKKRRKYKLELLPGRHSAYQFIGEDRGYE
jgi:hypothetical protein